MKRLVFALAGFCSSLGLASASAGTITLKLQPDLLVSSPTRTPSNLAGTNGPTWVYKFTVKNGGSGVAKNFWVRVYNVKGQITQSFLVSSLAPGATTTLQHIVDQQILFSGRSAPVCE